MLHSGDNLVMGVPVAVERKRIRRINIRIGRDGVVRLSIPKWWATLKDGEDFLSLMDAYGEDEAMLSDPARTEGYYISDDSYLISAEFIEGSMLLEQPGDVSSPLRSSAGLHLTQYVSDVTPGEVPLESVYEQIKDAALAQKQDDYYDQATDALLDAANVKYYPERLQ